MPGKNPSQLRAVAIQPGFMPYAEGSALVSFGNTKVICTASVEETVPPFLTGRGQGWLTAEYNMLPRSTMTRKRRDRDKLDGRTVEIQRLIGRALRPTVDLKKLGERTLMVDCDVLQADGGTRTAAITGAYVALHQALQRIIDLGLLNRLPIREEVAAISCGLYNGEPVLDLDYNEDSSADADANFVLTGSGRIVEIQGTAERQTFTEPQFQAMLRLAQGGIARLVTLQRDTLAAVG
ncbi:MAG: ribonuclease PH, partial [Planctomycetota bacterium]|nr:ribonuclease PH [Planctomycetota bacterium]